MSKSADEMSIEEVREIIDNMSKEELNNFILFALQEMVKKYENLVQKIQDKIDELKQELSKITEQYDEKTERILEKNKIRIERRMAKIIVLEELLREK